MTDGDSPDRGPCTLPLSKLSSTRVPTRSRTRYCTTTQAEVRHVRMLYSRRLKVDPLSRAVAGARCAQLAVEYRAQCPSIIVIVGGDWEPTALVE